MDPHFILVSSLKVQLKLINYYYDIIIIIITRGRFISVAVHR